MSANRRCYIEASERLSTAITNIEQLLQWVGPSEFPEGDRETLKRLCVHMELVEDFFYQYSLSKKERNKFFGEDSVVSQTDYIKRLVHKLDSIKGLPK